MNEDVKKKTVSYYLCGKCEKEMKVKSSGDFFSFLSVPDPMYCENKECEDWGYLKMVGIKKEKEVPLN